MNKRKKTWVKSESAFRQLGPALQIPMDIVPRQEASPTPRPSGTTPALEITPVDDISCLRNNIKKYHLSGKVADNNYHHCCCERQIDHYSPQISQALEFLTSLYDKNLSYWTLNTAHAALSSLFPKDWDDFGLLPLTVCFMIGLFENRPSTPTKVQGYIGCIDSSYISGHPYSTRKKVTQTPDIKADNVAPTGYGSKML